LSGSLFLLLAFGALTLWIPADWPTRLLEAALCAVALFSRHPVPRCYFPFIALLATVLYPVVQLAAQTTVYRNATLSGALPYWLAVLLCTVLAAQALQDPWRLHRFLHWLALFGFGVAFLATLQLFTREGKVFWLFDAGYHDLVLGPFQSRNNYAAFIELLLPIALFRLFAGAASRTLYLPGTAIMYASVVASGSRAGAVLATMEVFAVAVAVTARGLRPLRRMIADVGIAMVVFAFMVAVVGPEYICARLREPDPLTVRRELTISSFHMAQDRPWLGFGLGTWTNVYPGYALIDTGAVANHAHNEWAQWAAEGGFPFALLLMALFLWSILPAVRTIWGLGVVAVFLHAWVDYPFFRLGLAVWTFMLLGALVATPKSVLKKRRACDAETH
jgi:O-antigen ligase